MLVPPSWFSKKTSLVNKDFCFQILSIVFNFLFFFFVAGENQSPFFMIIGEEKFFFLNRGVFFSFLKVCSFGSFKFFFSRGMELPYKLFSGSWKKWRYFSEELIFWKVIWMVWNWKRGMRRFFFLDSIDLCFARYAITVLSVLEFIHMISFSIVCLFRAFSISYQICLLILRGR